MVELKPCPFCGAEGDNDIKIHDYYLPYSPNFGIRCIHLIYCDICGGAMIDMDPNHCWNDRAKAWNRRVPNGSD